MSIALLSAVMLQNSFANTSSEEVQNWCKSLSKELKSVDEKKCLSFDWKTEQKSPKGHPISYLSWGSNKPDAKRVLLIGALHGDEISAVSVAFRWLFFLERTKPDSFLRENKYLLIPLANPDGFWIKPRTRVNASKVDLNRNFETKRWKEDALKYWQTKTSKDPRRYPGQVAGSEKETQFLQKTIDEFKPSLIISIHAPYKLVDHDGPIDFPEDLSPLPVKALGAFPGSLGTYAGIERKIPVVTPELPNATSVPDQKALEQLFLFIMKSKY